MSSGGESIGLTWMVVGGYEPLSTARADIHESCDRTRKSEIE